MLVNHNAVALFGGTPQCAWINSAFPECRKLPGSPFVCQSSPLEDRRRRRCCDNEIALSRKDCRHLLMIRMSSKSQSLSSDRWTKVLYQQRKKKWSGVLNFLRWLSLVAILASLGFRPWLQYLSTSIGVFKPLSAIASLQHSELLGVVAIEASFVFSALCYCSFVSRQYLSHTTKNELDVRVRPPHHHPSLARVLAPRT